MMLHLTRSTTNFVNKIERFLRLSVRIQHYQCIHSAEQVRQNEGKEDGPVQFSTSKAAQTSLKDRFRTPEKLDRPKYQPYILAVSFLAFMMYFCVLREENDLDEIISKPLSEEMEEKNLKNVIPILKERGHSTVKLEKRYEVILQEKKDREKSEKI